MDIPFFLISLPPIFLLKAVKVIQRNHPGDFIPQSFFAHSCRNCSDGHCFKSCCIIKLRQSAAANPTVHRSSNFPTLHCVSPSHSLSFGCMPGEDPARESGGKMQNVWTKEGGNVRKCTEQEAGGEEGREDERMWESWTREADQRSYTEDEREVEDGAEEKWDESRVEGSWRTKSSCTLSWGWPGINRSIMYVS